MKANRIKSHAITTVVLSLLLLFTSAVQAFSQFKPGDNLYIMVNYVPRECRAKVDGYYCVTKKGKLSLPSIKIQISVDRDVKSIKEDLKNSIQNYCAEKSPGQPTFPTFDIISEADVKKAGNDVIVMGQARRPGIIAIKDGLTLHGAVREAGGTDEFSNMRRIVIIRNKKIIYCDLTKIESMKTLLKAGDAINIPMGSRVEGVY